MAGGFTEKEREQIRIALLSAGYKLSAECGIKKMTVALVAKSSGVAVGSFYNFFDSKEDFVLALIQEAEKEAEIRMVSAFAKDGTISLKKFLQRSLCV